MLSTDLPRESFSKKKFYGDIHLLCQTCYLSGQSLQSTQIHVNPSPITSHLCWGGGRWREEGQHVPRDGEQSCMDMCGFEPRPMQQKSKAFISKMVSHTSWAWPRPARPTWAHIEPMRTHIGPCGPVWAHLGPPWARGDFLH